MRRRAKERARQARCAGSRRAFTLVELLIVIAIVALMASLSLAGLWRATTLAKVRHTQALIAKLHDRVMARWAELRDRRLPIDPATAFQNAYGVAPTNARHLQIGRVLAKRELIRLELPQRWQDIIDNTVILPPNYTTSIRESYRANAVPTPPGNDAFEGSECLYLIVTVGQDDDPSLVEQFSRDDVGDVDGDGNPEFIDAWGRPIQFLRWAPGFLIDPLSLRNISDVQRPIDATDLVNNPPKGGDAMNPWRVNVDAPAQVGPRYDPDLTPLVYSAGPDGVFDIWHGMSLYANTAELNDPYFTSTAAASLNMQAGQPMTPLTSSPGEVGYVDNIHNHAQGAR